MNKIDVSDNKQFQFSGSFSNEHSAEFIGIRKDAQLCFYDSVSRNMKDFGIHHEIKYQKFAKFKYIKGIHFADMVQDATIFGKLLEFSLGKPLKKKLLKIRINTKGLLEYQKEFNNENSVEVLIGNFSLFKGENVKSHSQHSNFMLISSWKLEVLRMRLIIQKWFSNESFFAIYDIYLDSNNWFQDSDILISNVMYNNRFLNIVQGLEAYYRKITDTSVSKDQALKKNERKKDEFNLKKQEILKKLEKGSELKEWFNSNFNYKPPSKKEVKLEDILRNLLSSFDGILIPIFGKNEIIVFFPKYASAIRNTLSHGSHIKTNQGEALRVFFSGRANSAQYLYFRFS